METFDKEGEYRYVLLTTASLTEAAPQNYRYSVAEISDVVAGEAPTVRPWKKGPIHVGNSDDNLAEDPCAVDEKPAAV